MLVLSQSTALRALASLSLYEDLTDVKRTKLPNRCEISLPVNIESIVRQYDLEMPLDTLDFGSNCRSTSKLVRHNTSPSAYGNIFLKLQKNLYCASPELCFAQLCNKLDLVDAARLAAWMGGSYGLGVGGGLTSRRPLLDRRTLRKRLDSILGVHGVKLARRVASYVPLGSASPMESLIAIAFALPVELGGCGLRGVEVNAEIELSEEEQAVLHFLRIRPDFLWRLLRLVVEYDSDAFHTGAERIENDAARRNILVSKGYTVLTLTRKQVSEFYSFDAFCKQLRTFLGLADDRPWHLHRIERCELHRRLFHAQESANLNKIGCGDFWR